MYSQTLARSMTLYELLGRMQSTHTESKVAFGELIEIMEKRGFGPMLAVPAFIAATPIGAIPGIPTVTGVTIFLISLQILLAKKHPWLPGAIRDIGIDRASLNNGIGSIKPTAMRVDRYLVPRWLFMRQYVFRALIALACAMCGVMMVPLELIPFLGLIPAFSVLIMAVGMTTDDGVVALFGLSLAMVGFYMGGAQLLQTLYG